MALRSQSVSRSFASGWKFRMTRRLANLSSDMLSVRAFHFSSLVSWDPRASPRSKTSLRNLVRQA
eukprot:8553910-Pyramimonas_sp.AAC.1